MTAEGLVLAKISDSHREKGGIVTPPPLATTLCTVSAVALFRKNPAFLPRAGLGAKKSKRQQEEFSLKFLFFLFTDVYRITCVQIMSNTVGF